MKRAVENLKVITLIFGLPVSTILISVASHGGF